MPEVETQATGVAKFKVSEAGLAFKVNVANIENVFAAISIAEPPGPTVRSG